MKPAIKTQLVKVQKIDDDNFKLCYHYDPRMKFSVARGVAERDINKNLDTHARQLGYPTGGHWTYKINFPNPTFFDQDFAEMEVTFTKKAK